MPVVVMPPMSMMHMMHVMHMAEKRKRALGACRRRLNGGRRGRREGKARCRYGCDNKARYSH
jgi:hypothetical protein